MHCGDFTNRGTYQEIMSFNEWLGKLPHKYKIVIAGNHDFLFETKPSRAQNCLTNCIYLQDSEFVIKDEKTGRDIKIYGSPWQPKFWGVFQLEEKEAKEIWSKIPEDTDILMTHSPPFGIKDLCYDNVRAGCPHLRERVLKIRPDIHMFGHIHEDWGFSLIEEHEKVSNSGKKTVFMNIADRKSVV